MLKEIINKNMQNNTQSKIINFIDIKQDILKELNSRVENKRLVLTEKVNIVDGVVNQIITNEISNIFPVENIGTIPMIMLIGEESGQIYFFALRALLPKIFE